MELWGIPGEVIVQGGAAAVLLFAVLAIFSGLLVPARWLDRMLEVNEKRLGDANARGDEWRATAKSEEERNRLLTEQMNELLEVGRTTNALIEGLKRAANERSEAP